jgi:hypothetical protein
MSEVMAVVSRGEPLARFANAYVRAAIIKSNPGIDDHIPLEEKTIYGNFVQPIDKETQEELVEYIKKLPGLINLSMDGATVNGKQKVSIQLNQNSEHVITNIRLLPILPSLSRLFTQFLKLTFLYL